MGLAYGYPSSFSNTIPSIRAWTPWENVLSTPTRELPRPLKISGSEGLGLESSTTLNYHLCIPFLLLKHPGSPVTTPIEPVKVRLSATITPAPIAIWYILNTGEFTSTYKSEARASPPRLSIRIIAALYFFDSEEKKKAQSDQYWKSQSSANLIWDEMSKKVRKVSKAILGESKSFGPRDKESWWWNDNFQEKARNKKKCFKALHRCNNVENFTRYKKDRNETRKTVGEAQSKAFEEF
ncbi:hypothetical protein CR513_45471, partial [Mucuna pruriens]